MPMLAFLLALCLSSLCLFTAAPSWAQSADPVAPSPAVSADSAADAAVDAPSGVPEQILVVGQKPGPGMWKVSKGEHVLWVFGTYSPLPLKMDWRSHEVEAVIGRSQEYLAPPTGKAGLGFFQGVMVLPLLIGINDNPDGATLRDVLPADVYARWLPLKEKYLPKHKERERPIFAANALFGAAMKQAGLSTSTDVRKQVEKIVDAKQLKTTRTELSLPIENARRTLKDFKKSPLDDTACFAATLTRLETDIDAMRLRANAWAKGDIERIRKLDFVDQQESCTTVLLNSVAARDNPAFLTAQSRLQAMWLANAEAALARNASTFALLSMKDVLNPKGLLAALAAKGYTVEQPE